MPVFIWTHVIYNLIQSSMNEPVECDICDVRGRFCRPLADHNASRFYSSLPIPYTYYCFVMVILTIFSWNELKLRDISLFEQLNNQM